MDIRITSNNFQFIDSCLLLQRQSSLLGTTPKVGHSLLSSCYDNLHKRLV